MKATNSDEPNRRLNFEPAAEPPSAAFPLDPEEEELRRNVESTLVEEVPPADFEV